MNVFGLWFFFLSYFNYLMKGNVIHNQNQYSTFVVYKLLHIVAIQIQGRVLYPSILVCLIVKFSAQPAAHPQAAPAHSASLE